mmetsp:Transcript_14810/g.31757  ORF Transcript_14810/g.31757 Transcript_14810/m.31757 type:complete len:247 (+) Transcript_14810:74-814(+)|eukprot:CAMPEP_0185851016 /NCGR_PEP_ID=MMETSP1354-20130828/5076_1 /TAXON_ID=708628 /ORGANISM="Erythrolobus madagascarensis, Strain CCMP3276" /LENGTH=246 /DNA_ID=CAMNT_0028551767 /DNA_START=23 /DNA_END=763 /DNA_ORIENTATION=-
MKLLSVLIAVLAVVLAQAHAQMTCPCVYGEPRDCESTVLANSGPEGDTCTTEINPCVPCYCDPEGPYTCSIVSGSGYQFTTEPECEEVEKSVVQCPAEPPLSPCEEAAATCAFKLSGPDANSCIDPLPNSPDVCITSEMTYNGQEILQVGNTNLNPNSEYYQDGAFVAIQSISPGPTQAFSPSFWKPLVTCVGHETPQSNQAEFVYDRCVRLWISSVQFLGPDGQIVNENFNDFGDNCVVFTTCPE